MLDNESLLVMGQCIKRSVPLVLALFKWAGLIMLEVNFWIGEWCRKLAKPPPWMLVRKF